ncbi:MAG: Mpo1-like protein [Myxococcota bacterium]
MKTADQWFELYGESHQNATNKLIHWLCIPAIVLSLFGLLASIPVTFGASWLNPATLVLGLGLGFYLLMSVRLALGMFVVSTGLYLGAIALEALPMPLWVSSLLIFVVAWIGQFIGHIIEGKKPSFFQDLQFLLIGPLWLLGFVYRRAGISY